MSSVFVCEELYLSLATAVLQYRWIYTRSSCVVAKLSTTDDALPSGSRS